MAPTSQHLQALDLARSGHVLEAEVIYRQLLKSDPADAEALHFFGILAFKKDDAAKAELMFRQALEARPNWAKVWNSLGGTLHSLRRLEDAVRAISEAVRLEPESVEWRFNLGIALRAAGRLPEAAETLRAVTESAPNNAEAFVILGEVLIDISHYLEAELACRRAIEINPRFAEAYNNLGIALRALGRTQAAERAYRHAIDIKPEKGLFHSNLANVHLARGNLTGADAEYRNSLELEPTITESYRMLADLKSIRLGDSLFLRMNELLRSDIVPKTEKIDLHFALAAVLEENNDYDGAFGHWQTGNNLKNSALKWKNAGREDSVRRAKTVFNKDLLARHLGDGSPSSAPIFVLGMPRSGTTLVEQILASHSQVDAGGELPVLQRLAHEVGYLENGAQLNSVALKELGERYLSEAHSGKCSNFTDKMPNNYFRIGMIRLILPNAHIIHCRRDPVDTCLSCFRTLFRGNSQGFSYNLRNLGLEYRRYQSIMDHWIALMPNAMHEVHYEDMIADKDREIRRLLDFCGLRFEEACLQFHKTDRLVDTASASQVRREIYGTAVQRWKNYEKHLQPLLQIIGPHQSRSSV